MLFQIIDVQKDGMDGIFTKYVVKVRRKLINIKNVMIDIIYKQIKIILVQNVMMVFIYQILKHMILQFIHIMNVLYWDAINMKKTKIHQIYALFVKLAQIQY